MQWMTIHWSRTFDWLWDVSDSWLLVVIYHLDIVHHHSSTAQEGFCCPAETSHQVYEPWCSKKTYEHF
jgi:hypothetical protein